MTYCLGWRTQDGVVIVADSLLSAEHPDMHQQQGIPRTTFGERQGRTNSPHFPYVAEEGLKLRVGADFVAGFAGDVRVGQRLLGRFQEAHAAGRSLYDAANAAMRSAGGKTSDTTVLIGGYAGKKPVLLRIDTASQSISYVDGLVQTGSVPGEQQRWTEKMVARLAGLRRDDISRADNARRLFMPLIALLQSYGVHDQLLDRGIGGAFLGAWVTPDGARWQHDALYAVHEPAIATGDAIFCGVLVRPGIACLVSNQTEEIKLITMGEGQPDPATLALADEAIAQFDHAIFDYFVSINSGKHIVTVIDMQRSRHHALLSIRAAATAGTIGITWTEALVNIVNTVAGVSEPDGQELTLYFLPYMPVAPDAGRQREQFAIDGELARLDGAA